ncbi:MAG: hypothetical protein LBG89_03605 [Rickettsiales bacterium]|nr:hypothetical protein [Rickettsiales bacterium]
MHRLIVALSLVALYAPDGAAAPKSAKCKTADLVKCIDSVCLTDLATDPGSRCVLCGSAKASEIAGRKKDTYHGAENAPKFQALSLGANSKILISDKDLKKAPSAPDERYAWAVNQCLEKVSNCEADDAREEYDPLIETSCRAFMSAEEYSAAASKVAAVKSEETCRTEIGICMTNDLRCGAGWVNCKGDMASAAFDKFYSSCLLESGCVDNGGAILAYLKAQSKSVDEAIDARLAGAKAAANAARKERWNAIVDVCTDGVAKKQCIANYCAMFDTAMGAHGTPGGAVMALASSGCVYAASRSMAESICSYVDEICKIEKQSNFDFGDR